MKSETLQSERQQLENKLRELRLRMVRSLEQGRPFGLDRQIRQVQQSYRLMGRV